jgi:hypothetical protein
MTDAYPDSATGGASGDHGAVAVARDMANWLSLAAAPTFAIMALVSSAFGVGQPDMLCSPMQGASLPGGMVPMYLLMSAFHLAPWLKLISTRRGKATGRD